jgi:hypothetical protein
MNASRTHLGSPRLIAVATCIVAMLIAPAAALALPSPQPRIVAGESVVGTLAPAPGASTIYAADFFVRLRAGQTLAATFTPSAEVTQPRIGGWAMFATTAPLLISRSASPTPVSLYLLAPRTGDYHLVLAAESAPGTFTLDTAIVPALPHSVSPVDAPSRAMLMTWFRVTCRLYGTFDELDNPVKFIVQRQVRGRWKPYSTLRSASSFEATGDPSYVQFRANLKLPVGTFRIRSVFTDAAQARPQSSAWRTIRSQAINLTSLPAGMTPRTALKTYLQAILDGKYKTAYSLLPPAQKRSYGSAKAYAEQVRTYGITDYRMGPSHASGSTVWIVSQQSTPAMDITYTWTYVRIGGAWYVKSRTMGGTL